MNDFAIRVEGLSKHYRLGSGEKRYKTLRESLMTALAAPFSRRASGSARSIEDDERSTIWALKDVSFEVPRGEVMGLIGRNGAGKSTLLKILARITEPTQGRVAIHGRIGSLLEVGTGFHPELSGRENVFMNAAILGMRRAEIVQKFDEIIAFAELERFVDTPVKRYSSGMYTRLAFAVAAHMEPEILLVDEVLAVGDMRFQQRCLGKMNEIATKDGRTVIFISHQMGAITSLCQSAILLERGAIKSAGRAQTVIGEYIANLGAAAGYADLRASEDRQGAGEVRVTHACLRDQNGDVSDSFAIGDDIVFEFAFDRHRPIRAMRIGVRLSSVEGLNIANMVDQDSGFELYDPAEREVVQLRLKDVRFYPGSYLLGIWLGDPTSSGPYDSVENCVQFHIISGGKLCSRSLDRGHGHLFLTPDWSRMERPAAGRASDPATASTNR